MFNRKSIPLMIATVVGLAMVVAGWLTTDYLSNLLLQVGSALVLVVPLVALTLVAEQWVRRDSAEPSEAEPAPAPEPAHPPAGSDPDPVEPPEDGLPELLDAAVARAAVGRHGIRVPIPGSTRRLWLGGGSSDAELAVQELDGREVGHRVRFGGGPGTQDFASALRGLAADAGTELPDPSALEEELVRALRLAVDARTAAHVNDLGELLEVVNRQWALSADGMRGLDRYYFIPRDRLTEADPKWPTLVAGGRAWIDAALFEEAYRAARALYPNLPQQVATAPARSA